MCCAQDVAKSYFGRRPRQEIPAFFATNTASDSLGFQLNQDLNEVIGRDTPLGREILDANRFATGIMSRQFQHCAGRVIALDR